MGTRNLICAVIEGKYRLAQYCQWDGYPEGQGKTIYQFLKTCDLPEFKKQVIKLRPMTDEEVQGKWEECGANDSGLVDIETSNRMKVSYPHLTRDIGANILALIAAGKVEGVKHSLDFAGDSLFCEWAYVIDLDRDVLEVYQGFQEKPHTGQRFSEASYEQAHRGQNQYYPVAFLTEFSIKNIPASDAEFIEAINKCLPDEKD